MTRVNYKCSRPHVLFQEHSAYIADICPFIHIYTCTYTYIHTHTHTNMHTHRNTYIHTNTHTHIYIYIHTYIHTCTYTYIQAYIRMYIIFFFMIAHLFYFILCISNLSNFPTSITFLLDNILRYHLLP